MTLMSLSSSDYPDLLPLCDALLEWCEPHKVNLALPSLRADNFSMNLMEKLQRGGRKSGLTFAPEAGSQRLRDAINKNVTEEDLLNSCLLYTSILSLPCALGFNLLSGIHPLGGSSNFLDLEDFLVSNIILPVGSLIFLLFAVSKRGWGWENFMAEANEMCIRDRCWRIWGFPLCRLTIRPVVLPLSRRARWICA